MRSKALWHVAVIGVALVSFALVVYRRPALLFGGGTSLDGQQQQQHATKDRDALRVMFMTDKVINYDHGMDRHFFFWFDAVAQSAAFDAFLWGRGFDGYDRKRTLTENLVARFGSVHIDAVVLYGMVPNDEVAQLSRTAGVVVVVREHECFETRCASVVLGNNATVAMLTYSQEIAALVAAVNAASSVKRLFVHSPHCADRNVFLTPILDDDDRRRRSGVVVVGATNNFYPLRRRWIDLATSGAIRATIRRHPGYFVKGATAKIMHRQTVEYAR
jgi:hypothetical protein